MSRRKAFLAALALCGGVAVSVTPLASAAPTSPVQCPPHPLVTSYEGNYYVWLPNPARAQDSSASCWISVEVPGTIQKPPPVAAAAIPPLYQPCPTHVLLTQYEGTYYVWLPNPTGTSCWITVAIPVGTTIQPPPVGAAGANQPPVTIPVPGPNGCPTEPIAYESNGHDYVATPDPSGQQTCGHYTELPVTVPPTL